MSALLARFDRWVDSGPFTASDLGIYRIVYAVVMLLSLPAFRWVDAFPDSLFTAPPGPFMLLDGFPPTGVMTAVEITLSVALVALAMRFFTTAASAVTALLLLYGFGVSFSLGKIDHTIFVVLVPAVLLFARWGDVISIDALLRRPSAAGDVVGRRLTAQWPMRLLALLIGLGFLTAAIPKALSGWLDPRTQAVQEVLARQYYVNGRTELLAPLALQMDVPLLWELGDIFAVLIEVAILLTVPWWRAFRVALAAAAIFHLGVLLTMNIFFAGNVLVYGAFVSWSALRLRGATAAQEPQQRDHAVVRPARDRLSRRWVLLAAAVAVAGGFGIWTLRQHVDLSSTSWAVLVTGAAVATWYLVRQALRLLGGLRGRRVVIDLRRRSDQPQPAYAAVTASRAGAEQGDDS